MTAGDDHDDHQDGDVPGGLPPGLPDMESIEGMDLGGLLASAQEAMSAQAEAAEREVEGTAGGGVVKVTMTGGGEVTAVSLDRQVVDPDDIEMLQDLIVAALADAGARVTAIQREAMGALGQMDIGGLSGSLGDLLGGEPGR